VEPASPTDDADPAPAYRPETRRSSAPSPPSLSEGERQDFRRVLDLVPAPEFSTGSGTITGRVSTPDGEPLDGVLVRAARQRTYPYRYKRGKGPPEADGPEDRLREYAERLHYEHGNRREAVTGSEGGFTLTEIADDAEYRISAWKRGYEIRARPSSRKYRAGDKVELLAKPLALVPVEIVLPAGGPPEEAKIEIRVGTGTQRQGWTPDEKEIGLEPGTVSIRAVGGEEGEFASEEQEVEVDVENPPSSLTFRLEARPGIRGRVTFPEGQEYSYGEVSVLRILPGKEADPQRLVREGQRKTVYSYRDGKFLFLDLPAGSYLLGLVMNRRDVVASASVEVSGGMVVHDLVAPAPDPEDSVVVRAEGPDGKLVTDLYLTTGYTGPKGSGTGVALNTRLPDGTFRVAHHVVQEEHEDPDVRHWINVRSNRFGAQRVEYDRASTRELTVRFEAPATLEVTLDGYLGTEYEGVVRLSLREASKGGSGSYYSSYYGGSRQNPLSAEGKQKFGPVQPGDYVISVGLQMERYGSRTVATVPVALKSGANRETVSLPALYTLTVLLDAKDGSQVYIRQQGGYTSASKKVKDGRAVFEKLAAGDYTIHAQGKQMVVKIPGQTEVRLEGQAMNAYRVSITDPKGNMAQAGLQDGDVIIGIDDTEFEDTSQMWAAVTLAKSKKSVTLTLIRGNARHRMSVDFGKIYQHPQAGGSLQYTHHE
jgi:hypothetical protein